MTAWDSVDDATSYARTLLTGDRVRLRALHEDDLSRHETWWAEPELAILQQDMIRPRPAASMHETFQR